jgi:hypothetical protein
METTTALARLNLHAAWLALVVPHAAGGPSFSGERRAIASQAECVQTAALYTYRAFGL